MIKIIYCIARKPELTREEFQKYWVEIHGAAVWERAQTIGMRGFVQCRTVDSVLGAACAETRGTDGDYDGVMHGWWDSDDSAVGAFNSEAGTETMNYLFADEATFMDFSRSRIFTVEETIWGLPENERD